MKRDCEFNDEGYVRWSYFLMSSKPITMTKAMEDKLKEINLLKKCRKFMDSVKQSPVIYCVEILEFCDGFQLNLSAKETTEKDGVKAKSLASISYFIWRVY